MTTKLTLSVEKRIIQKAKRYARTQKRSLSELVTSYLDYVSNQTGEEPEIDPEVLEASGHIPAARIADPDDLKFRYLKDKYLNE